MRKTLLVLAAAATLAGAAACGTEAAPTQPELKPSYGFLGSGGFIDTTRVPPGDRGNGGGGNGNGTLSSARP